MQVVRLSQRLYILSATTAPPPLRKHIAVALDAVDREVTQAASANSSSQQMRTAMPSVPDPQPCANCDPSTSGGWLEA
jgi:hypothetical protein